MTDSIDATPSVPPPGKEPNREYLTRDIMSALERAVLLLIDRKVVETGLTRRLAAAEVLRDLCELAR